MGVVTGGGGAHPNVRTHARPFPLLLLLLDSTVSWAHPRAHPHPPNPCARPHSPLLLLLPLDSTVSWAHRGVGSYSSRTLTTAGGQGWVGGGGGAGSRGGGARHAGRWCERRGRGHSAAHALALPLTRTPAVQHVAQPHWSKVQGAAAVGGDGRKGGDHRLPACTVRGWGARVWWWWRVVVEGSERVAVRLTGDPKQQHSSNNDSSSSSSSSSPHAAAGWQAGGGAACARSLTPDGHWEGLVPAQAVHLPRGGGEEHGVLWLGG